ncbi:MAG: ACT domain-containing protein [Firmicutes bacterium]|nr:ACT domain-containing protein [Bacillota bacterium]
MESIAVLGPIGTFSDEAKNQFQIIVKHSYDSLYCSTMEEVINAVKTKAILAIVPIENTLDGYVQRNLDLLLQSEVSVIGELTIPIQFSMVANAKNIKDVNKIFVQYVAKGQCNEFFKTIPNVKIITTESNSESFQLFSKGIDHEGAIIPFHLFNSQPIKFGIENVTDSFHNETRFLIVKKGSFDQNLNILDKKNQLKVSLVVKEADDKPGVLFSILEEFSKRKINLISIMSRPTKEHMGKYNFFIELVATLEDQEIIFLTIQQLSVKYFIKVLGIYPKI